MTRRKKSKVSKSPLIRLVGLDTAAVVAAAAAAGMTCSPAMAAPGDLDPSFGDVGRQSDIALPSYSSNLWSVDVQADDSVLFGGGGEYGYYEAYFEDDFVGRLLPNGTPDASFVAAALANTVVYDTVPQSDGKVIGAGVAGLPDGKRKLLVFRLRPDGSLDPDFGLAGQVIISDGGSSLEAGYSVVVDPDGRIVVAGQRGSNLLVARLLPNGVPDTGFGTAGVFVGAAVSGNPIRIAGVPGGAYRVAANFNGSTGADCRIASLTSAGGLDAAFGSGGYAAAQSSGGGSPYCTSMAAQPDGRLLVGGTIGGVDGYVARLLPSGAPDPSFSAGEVAGRFSYVSALAASSAGPKIFVTGADRTGFSGALVVRLLADGTRDTSFGRDGATTVDLKTRRTYYAPTINDMKVVAGGGLVVAANANNPYGTNAFVARLLGDTAGGGPGVLGLKQSRMLATEQAGQIVLAVQRTGGSSGPIAVTYSTRDVPVPPAPGAENALGASANGGVDYTSMTGRLTWADGDVGDREIVVPIATDTNAEPPEFFEVVLESPEGGAGLATFGSDLEIAGASYPSGDFTIRAEGTTVSEGEQATFRVSRNYYSQGAVSVTVRVAAGGSATPGQDFYAPGRRDWQDVVLTWADGEYGDKYLPIDTIGDGIAEPAEVFTLELVAPTGGAALGATTQATMQIDVQASPPPPPPTPPRANRGGGSFGWLGAMLLLLGGALRRRIQNR